MLGWFRRRSDVGRIRQLEIDHNVAGLIAELIDDTDGDGDKIVGSYAALALGRLGDRRAVPYLVELVGDPDYTVRKRVVRALVKLRAEGTASVFVGKLDDSAPVIRMLAAEGLGAVGDSTVIPCLRQTLDTDPDPEVRMYAAEALLALGDAGVRARIPEVVGAVSWRVRGHPRWKRLKEAGTPRV